MGIIGWIILGLLAGLIAKAILPGNDPGGAIVTIIIGIVGAVLGGFLASRILDIDVNEEFFDLATWVSAIVGSLILLGASTGPSPGGASLAADRSFAPLPGSR